MTNTQEVHQTQLKGHSKALDQLTQQLAALDSTFNQV